MPAVEIFSAVAGACGALCSVFALGSLALARAGSIRDDRAAAFLVGLGGFGLFSFALLLLGRFDRVYLLALAAAAVATVIIRSGGTFVRAFPGACVRALRAFDPRTAAGALACLVAFATLVLIVLNVVPISAGDAFVYHMPFVQDMIASHGLHRPIAGITDRGFGYFPALAEILFASVVLLSGASSMGIPLAFFQSAVLIALLAMLNTRLRPRMRNDAARWGTLLLLLGSADVWLLVLRVGMIDLLLYAMLLSGALLLYEGVEQQDAARLYAGSFLLALALAMKYIALIAVAYCGVAVIAAWLFGGKKISYRTAACCLVLILLIPLYWYLANAAQFHNPIYPLLTGAGPDRDILSNDFIPHTLPGVILRPILVYAPFFFVASASRLAVFELCIALGALAGTLFLFLRRRGSMFLATLVSFALFYSWSVGFLSDDIRYHLPAFFALAIAAGIVLDVMIEAGYLQLRSAAALIAVFFLASSLITLRGYGDRIRELSGSLSPAAYLGEKMGPAFTLDQYRRATAVVP